MKAKLKKKLAFLMLLGGVGHAMAHTASESNEVARTMLEVATIYNGYHGCKTGDVLINYGLPQVFFGRIDTGEGWTYEGRQAAFDQYVKTNTEIEQHTVNDERYKAIEEATSIIEGINEIVEDSTKKITDQGRFFSRPLFA